MIQEQPNKTWIVVITTIISTAGVVCVAIMSLGLPFAQKAAEKYYATSEPLVIVVTGTPNIQPPEVINAAPTISSSSSSSISDPQANNPMEAPADVTVISNNLVQNPGFESGIYSGGWEWGLPTVDIQNGYNSSSALCSKQELQSNQNVGWVGFHQNVPVAGNQKYTLSAWVKLQNASQVHIKILWFDSNFAEISNNFIMGGTDGNSDWRQHGGVANFSCERSYSKTYVLAWCKSR